MCLNLLPFKIIPQIKLDTSKYFQQPQKHYFSLIKLKYLYHFLCFIVFYRRIEIVALRRKEQLDICHVQQNHLKLHLCLSFKICQVKNSKLHSNFILRANLFNDIKNPFFLSCVPLHCGITKKKIMHWQKLLLKKMNIVVSILDMIQRKGSI